MDLMSLLAKLTLDKTQYDKGLEDAEKDAKDLKVPTPKLTVDKKEFNDNLDEGEKEASVFSQVVTGVWQGLKSSLVSVGVTGVILGVANALKQGVRLAIDNGKEISDNSKNLQMSTRAYQEYEYVLGKSNIQMKDLSKVMKNIDAIRGGKITEDQAAYLEKLGINAEDAKGGLLSAETMLDRLMKGLSNYGDSDKGAIIDAFFGSSDKWTGYFAQSEEEIENLKKEASDMGLIMSDESIQNAVKFNEATEKLQDRLDAIKRAFGEGILPVITEAVNKLMMIVDFFTNSDTRTSTEKFVDQDKKFEAKISDIEAQALTAKTLTNTLLGMGSTEGMSTTQLAIWKGTAESLIKMIPTLSGVIDVENGVISENAAGIGEIIDQYTELEKATAYQTTKAEKQNIIDQKKNKLTEEAVKANEKLAEAEGNRMQAVDAFNEVLKKYNVEGIGYDATMEDINKAKLAAMSNAGGEYEMAMAESELREAANPLTDAIQKAQLAQAEVDSLTVDIEEGEAAFAEWTETQGALYGDVSDTAHTAADDVNAVTDALNNIPSDTYSTIHITTDGEGYPNAIGNRYVPYDNYPALLHRGERVLTATEARRGDSVDLPGLEDRIISAIRAGMAGASVNAYMSGQGVADMVNTNTSNELKSRRFAP